MKQKKEKINKQITSFQFRYNITTEINYIVAVGQYNILYISHWVFMVCEPVWGECMHVLECVYLLLYCIFVLHCMDQSKSHTLHRWLPDTACLVILWSK